jgi:WD40-like Beta Propeller Repeat
MLKALLMAIVGALVAQQPAAPPPSTDIYELEFDGTLAGLKNAKAQIVSTEPGYDNQPFYTPDGAAILFTANRDGKQMDIYEFDRAKRAVRRLVSTPEGEYSPTVTPDGAGVSVIRVEADSTQRLWRFDRNGANPRLVLTDIKPVGYHAWIDADQLALFVLGQPATLQHARISTGKAVVIAQDIGRSVQRIPKTQTISFIHREPAAKEAANSTPRVVWVKQFDPASGAVTPLVRAVAGSEDAYTAWMPDGTLLMSAGTKIFAWQRGDKDWREVYDTKQVGAAPPDKQ